MDCPVCGKEMTRGWLYGRAPWSSKQGKASMRTGKGDVSLWPDPLVVSPALDYPVAHICKDCRRVVVEY